MSPSLVACVAVLDYFCISRSMKPPTPSYQSSTQLFVISPCGMVHGKFEIVKFIRLILSVMYTDSKVVEIIRILESI